MDKATNLPLTKQKFWEILTRAHDNDTNVYLAKLETEIAALCKDEIAAFRGWAAAYLSAAEECAWLDMACKVIDGYVSDDSALYFALWVIAQGEERLLAALRDPDTLADLPFIPFGEAEFELLMYVGFDPDSEQDELSSGQPDEQDSEEDFSSPFEYSPPPETPYDREVAADIVYKNGDRYGGFDTFEDAMEAIPEHLPRLIARAEREGFDWKNYI